MAEKKSAKVPEPLMSYESCVLGLSQLKHRIKLLDNCVTSFSTSDQSQAELLYNVNCYLSIEDELKSWEMNMIIAWGSLADEETAVKKHRPEFDACRSTLKKIFISLEQLKSMYHRTSPTPHTVKTNAFKLERIKLKPFSGLFEEWQEFKDLFTSAVDSNSSYSGAEKMFYLKSSLSGDALSIVSSFPSTSASYTEAWKLVQRRYENEREIVFAHIRKLETVNKASDSSSGIRKIIDTLNECVRSLKIHDVPVEDWDVMLCYLVLKKLDEETKREWLLSQSTALPKLDQMVSFLETRGMALMDSVKSKPQVNQRATHVAVSSPTLSKCPKCVENHMLLQCPSVKALNVEERGNFIKSKSLCFNCFRTGHGATNCTSRYTCRECGRKHHTMLHRQSVRPVSTPQKTTTPVESASHCAIPSIHSNHVLLGTLLANVNDCTGVSQTVRIFVDNGSASCFISEQCVDRLGLSRSKSCIKVTGISGAEGISTKGIVPLTLHSRKGDFSLKINELILGKITNILLGAEFESRIKLPGIIHGPHGTPTAEETEFGWMLTGSYPTNSQSHISASHHVLKVYSIHSSCRMNDSCLEMNLKKFWELEQPDFIKSSKEVQHQDLEDYYMKTTRRDKEGRYCVRFPFLQNHEPLGESHSIAIRKFLKLENRIQMDNLLFKSYVTYMDDSCKNGIMERVPSSELNSNPGKSYYMPYHEVVKESSTSTKVRIVYNCSSKTRKGPSLNDILNTGPKLQNDLVPLLVRFRSYPIAISTGIVKFFNQFSIGTEDTNYQRLIWRQDPKEDFQEYRLTCLSFGVTSAPYLACRTFNKLVDDECKNKIIAKLLKRDILVDNILTGGNSVEEVMKLQRVICEVMSKGRLELRKWASNSSQILENIPLEHQEKQSSLLITDEFSLFTLGLKWFPDSDTLSVNVPVFTDSHNYTKRSVLSHVARVFDPLGWISPITIRAKIFLQKLWKFQFDWDTQLPDSFKKEWKNYLQDLQRHDGFSVERCFSSLNAANPNVHVIGFCDASNVAYSAVVYPQSFDCQGQPKVTLIASRTKVAPVKGDTTPPLELCGATLLAKLIKSICESLTVTFKSILCFTDSTNVLHWLQSNEKLPVFVHNRVRTILELLPHALWNHVNGCDNPADATSRGISSLFESEVSKHWLHGPDWLSTYQTAYHLKNIIPIGEHNAHASLITFISSRSDYNLIIRHVAIWIRFLHILKNKKQIPGPLTNLELAKSLSLVIRIVQKQSLSKEIQSIQQKIRKLSGPIRFMAPFLDDNEVLRVGGRLSRSTLEKDKIHPMLLPTKHPFVTTLVRYYHESNCHAGPTLLLALLIREKFWIIKEKTAVNRVVKACVKCHKANPSPLHQIMGVLPPARVTASRAFLHTGMEFAGPSHIKVTTGRKPKHIKAYICLFICMSTKAIHIELVQDLTTPSFVASLKRFVSRRGLPSDLYSDGGRNFIGAKNEFQEIHKFLVNNQNKMALFSTEMGINFHINPPLAPHHGGLFEAGVKSAKILLSRIVQNHVLTIEEFSTLLCQIEATLNCRPLTPMSEDPNDFSILTPFFGDGPS